MAGIFTVHEGSNYLSVHMVGGSLQGEIQKIFLSWDCPLETGAPIPAHWEQEKRRIRFRDGQKVILCFLIEHLFRCYFLNDIFKLGSIRVSDPHWFNADPDTDPDPAFFQIADPDSGSGILKLTKFIAGNLISIFLIKNCNLLIPRPP